MANCCCLCLLIAICPPIAVYVSYDNQCNGQVWLNVLLCCLFVFPGIIHAIAICCCINK